MFVSATLTYSRALLTSRHNLGLEGAALRQQLSALRASATIGDAAFQHVEQELDWRELDLEQLLRPQ
jgi:hypothetical protein